MQTQARIGTSLNAVELRKKIIDFLQAEIIGPSPAFPAVQPNGEEILRPMESPKDRYGAAILFPRKAAQQTQEVAAAADDSKISEADEIEEGNGTPVRNEESNNVSVEAPDQTEQEVALANEYLPSAMGLTALVRVPEVLCVEVSTARYEKLPLAVGKDTHYWFRRPLNVTVEIHRSELEGERTKVLEKKLSHNDEDLHLSIHLVSRPYPPKSSETRARLITFTAVNNHIAGGSMPSNEDCFFQFRFCVRSADNGLCFLPYPDQLIDLDDPEVAALALLYRHVHVYAIGHGCAPEWNNAVSGMVSEIRTESMPIYDVKPIKPTELPDVSLGMRELSEGSSQLILSTGSKLADLYEAWLKKQNDKLSATNLSTKLLEAATKNFQSCNECLQRIRRGVEILNKDGSALEAFRLMNKSMLMQQAHYRLSSKNIRRWKQNQRVLSLESRYTTPDYQASAACWRPFQLGFVLMNIDSIVNADSGDRKLVDIIWFPTGGGKTEAYLGLAAFAMFFRRLKNPKNGGTCAIMRYTLRLLTAQQFQRAASLICACELMRRKSDRLGSEPFTIGLWVGGAVTPNTGSDAVKCLSDLERGSAQNKFIVLSCPWCGSQMGPVKVGTKTVCKGYQKISGSKVELRCEDPDCEFSGKLPLSVIDQELYENPPSLLIGTVDKFAMMTWDPRTGVFFGRGRGADPPDLIIQDELHLISGPLGSMVGLYESLIELLSRRKGIPAKIVASTATISRASEQVRALYGRDSALFPPQCLKAGDSFFAFEDKEAQGRTYVGVFATALPSHTTSQVRSVAALLQAVKYFNAASSDAMDAFWTLIGYYNSIRELGHAVTLLTSDVTEQLRVLYSRYGMRKEFPDLVPLRRYINRHDELTSRVHSSELPAKLQALFTPYDGAEPTDAVDVCLATNMIQVGLDVSRLSLMLMQGQPKATSEYIQASSRIGREAPGLVVVNYCTSKPRDRSHFEHFRQYHQSLYRWVEPTSVTPFALPVCDRALHAIVIALVRLWGGSELSEHPVPPPDKDLQRKICGLLLDRVNCCEPEEYSAVERMLKEIFSRWEDGLATKYGEFKKMAAEPVPLMYPAGTAALPEWEGRSYETPSSMRAVDADCEAKPIASYPFGEQ